MSIKEIKIGGGVVAIKEFTFDQLCENPTICIIAKRGSGKSWLCRSLLKYFRYIPGGIIISKTERSNNFYGHFFPNLYIYDDYKSEILSKLSQRQELIIEKCKKKYKKNKKVDPRAILLMDDCLADRGKWIHDPPIHDIFFNGRHNQLTFILTMQYSLGVPPDLRGNFDYVFLFFDDIIISQKKLYEHYAGMFKSFDLFRQVFLQLTENYGCMVIINKGSKRDILDKIFYFKAKEENISEIGNKQFRDFHYKNYDLNWKLHPKHLNIDTLKK